MAGFAVLLRGVNVGKGQRVAMADWRALLADLGFAGVRTLGNSGNAVFESSKKGAAAHAKKVRTAMAEGLGLDVSVVVLDADELAAIRAENPLARVMRDPSKALVLFAQSSRDLAAAAAAIEPVAAPERFHLGARAGYLWCPNGILASRAAKALLGKAGAAVTTRNLATVTKLESLLQPTDR